MPRWAAASETAAKFHEEKEIIKRMKDTVAEEILVNIEGGERLHLSFSDAMASAGGTTRADLPAPASGMYR